MGLKSRLHLIFLVIFLFSLNSYLSAAEIGKKFEITWLGQAGFKIVSPSGTVILIDPWAKGNTLYPYKSSTGEPDLSPLLSADIVLLTHGHLDHLGDTIPIANDPGSKKELKIVSIFELMTYLWQEGVDQKKLVPMNIGGSVKVNDVQITMVRAVHSSGIGPFSPKSLVYGGEAAGFIIEMNNGFKIYHTGDTALFGEMKTYNTYYHPNLMLVPIGGLFTMGPKEAAMAVELVHPQYVIPMHYGGTFNLPGTPAEFKTALSKRGKGIKLIVATPGKPIN